MAICREWFVDKVSMAGYYVGMARGVTFSSAAIAAELKVTGGNVAEAARRLRMSAEGLRVRLKREPDLSKLANKLRTQSRDVQAADRELREQQAKNLRQHDSWSDDAIVMAILRHDGDLVSAATELGLDALHLKRRVSRTPVLMDAMNEGESARILRAESLYRDIAMGVIRADSNQRQALSDFLKCKAGWTPKTAVKHEGLVYDITTVPDEDVVPDLPMAN